MGAVDAPGTRPPSDRKQHPSPRSPSTLRGRFTPVTGVPRRCGSRCRHLCLCAAPRSACSSRRRCVVGSLAPETGAERLLPEQRRDRIVVCRAYSMCMCTALRSWCVSCVSEDRVDGVPRVRGVRHTWRHTRGRVRLCNLAWSLTLVCTVDVYCTIIDHATNLQPPTQSVSRFRCSLSVVTFK